MKTLFMLPFLFLIACSTTSNNETFFEVVSVKHLDPTPGNGRAPASSDNKKAHTSMLQGTEHTDPIFIRSLLFDRTNDSGGDLYDSNSPYYKMRFCMRQYLRSTAHLAGLSIGQHLTKMTISKLPKAFKDKRVSVSLLYTRDDKKPPYRALESEVQIKCKI